MQEYSVIDFGAIGDGKTDSTLAFRKALSEGGRTVVVPKGEYLTGPLDLLDDTVFRLEEGAKVSFIPDPSLYEPVFTRWEGVRCYAMHPCLFAGGVKNVKISGKGVIDGSGEWWWKEARTKKTQQAPETVWEKRLAELNPGYEDQPGGGGGRRSQFLRPSLVEFNKASHITLEGVTLQNSPFWTLHPIFSDHITLHDIKVINPSDAPNTDGIDVDSCQDVSITDSFISVGDDAICIKSGAGEDGVRAAVKTERVVVKGCTVHKAHGGVVIGSETAAGIKDVHFDSCSFVGIERGIRVKTRRGRGGHIEDITFRNIDVDGCLCPMVFNMYYRCGGDGLDLYSLEKQPITETTPRICNILIENLKAKGVESSAGFLVGLPEEPITNVKIKDAYIEISPTASIAPKVSAMTNGLPEVEERGIRIRNAQVEMENVQVVGAENPPLGL